MYRYGIVNKNGIVVNVISWDGETQWQPPVECIAVQHDYIDIDDFWDINDKVLIKAVKIAPDPADVPSNEV